MGQGQVRGLLLFWQSLITVFIKYTVWYYSDHETINWWVIDSKYYNFNDNYVFLLHNNIIVESITARVINSTLRRYLTVISIYVASLVNIYIINSVYYCLLSWGMEMPCGTNKILRRIRTGKFVKRRPIMYKKRKKKKMR